ncbi:hypothetical protein OUZ56_013923 [Daphnia magna]|uniref:Uncharacterized protein n=1 Tax=Daphnia magna TaxID=35525 RepID=A0ABQ9Z7C5_9CRUS|nr:hypothetical protein OUZ56_013923 [Daphnia magna]
MWLMTTYPARLGVNINISSRVTFLGHRTLPPYQKLLNILSIIEHSINLVTKALSFYLFSIRGRAIGGSTSALSANQLEQTMSWGKNADGCACQNSEWALGIIAFNFVGVPVLLQEKLLYETN